MTKLQRPLAIIKESQPLLEPARPYRFAVFDWILDSASLSNCKVLWQRLRHSGHPGHTYNVRLADTNATPQTMKATQRVRVELELQLTEAFDNAKEFTEWLKEEFLIYEAFPGCTFHVDPASIRILNPEHHP